MAVGFQMSSKFPWCGNSLNFNLLESSFFIYLGFQAVAYVMALDI